jgi:hypothetical protein
LPSSIVALVAFLAVRFAFFPVFSLLPVCCCSPVVVFAVRHWDLPAFPLGGFFAIVLLSFPSRRPVRFFLSFSFCLSVVVRLSSFSLSGIGTCRLFPAADFSPSSYCLFLPAVRFVSFRLFPFAGPLLFACRRFRCPALGPAGFSPRRIFRHRLIVFLFPLSGSFLSVFSLLPVRCCSLVVVFAVRQLGPAGFSPRRIFRQRLIVFSFPSSGSLFSVFFLLPVFPFLVCLFLRRFLYLIFLFCFSLLSFLRFVFSFLQGSGKRP